MTFKEAISKEIGSVTIQATATIKRVVKKYIIVTVALGPFYPKEL